MIAALITWLRRDPEVVISRRIQRLLDAAVFIGITGVLLAFFKPSLLFAVTTATGGDTGAHIYPPWYLKTELLPRGLIAGWSHDWFAGFPVMQFYFPLIPVGQALLGYFIPYEVAFKLAMVAGTLFLPIAIYVFFRLLRFRAPAPAMGAVVGLAFLLMTSFKIYGGNIASTLAGEYSYSLSLGLSFVFLGLAYRVFVLGEPRGLAATIVLALAVLAHLVPVMVAVAVVPLFCLMGMRKGVKGVPSAAASIGAIAFLLTSIWSFPFLARLQYTAGIETDPLRDQLRVLFPPDLTLFVAAALGSCLIAMLRREARFLLAMAPALAGLVLYLLAPPGPVWNGRFVPYWYIGVLMGAAIFTADLARLIAARFRQASVVLVLLTLVVTGSVIARGLVTRERSYLDRWIDHGLGGVENFLGAEVFTRLREAFQRLPEGRVLGELSERATNLGTPYAVATLPYFVGHPTVQGLYIESSITTPFVYLTEAEISDEGSRGVDIGVTYPPFDFEKGLEHLNVFNVRYLLLASPAAKRAATSAGLQERGGAYDFRIFEIPESGHVLVPRYEPIVVPKAEWRSESIRWFLDGNNLEIPIVADGPESWVRIDGYTAEIPRRPIEGDGISIEAQVTPDEISFETSAVGKPHLIRTSYFPNWKAEGADGPYLASPAFMIVIPQQSHVRLHYVRTWAEWTGLAASALGLILLFLPAGRKRLNPYSS